MVLPRCNPKIAAPYPLHKEQSERGLSRKMTEILRVLGIVFLALIFASIAIKLIIGLLTGVLVLIVPVLILGVVGYGLYSLLRPKALGGGPRILP